MESNTRIIKMYCLCTTKSDEKIKGQFFQKKACLKTKWGFKENFCRSWSERLENMGVKNKREVCEVI